jgi:hypothetical protein
MAIYQHVELDEADLARKPAPKPGDAGGEDAKESRSAGGDPVQVIMRLGNNKALAARKKVDKGEVIFIGTSSHPEGKDAATGQPNWSDFGTMRGLPPLVPFMDVAVADLIRGRTQTYNVIAGQTLNWTPHNKFDHSYDLVHPDRNVTRLGVPSKIEPDAADDKDDELQKKREKLELDRYVLAISDLNRAGTYRIAPLPKGTEGADTTDPLEAIKKGTPIAVSPDPKETADLSTLSAKQIDDKLGFTPIHIVAGEESVSTGEDRLNREWTVWALLALLVMLLVEVAFAWWCGRAW